jgi:hypothetical protein
MQMFLALKAYQGPSSVSGWNSVEIVASGSRDRAETSRDRNKMMVLVSMFSASSTVSLIGVCFRYVSI